MTYYAWLKTQKDSDHLIGIDALAMDAIADRSFPRKVATLSALIRYLKNCNACHEALEAALRSWKEWRMVRTKLNTPIPAHQVGLEMGVGAPSTTADRRSSNPGPPRSP